MEPIFKVEWDKNSSQYFGNDSQTKKSKLTNWDEYIISLIGAGKYGRVFKLCKNGNCVNVIKLVVLSDRDKKKEKRLEQSFGLEVKYTEMASKFNIGPKLYATGVMTKQKETIKFFQDLNFTVKKLGYMILRRYVTSLKRSVGVGLFTASTKKETEAVIRNVNTLIKKMHVLNKNQQNNYYGLLHCDLHTDNIMIGLKKNNPNSYDVRIIDFGLTVMIEYDNKAEKGYTIDNPSRLENLIKDYVKRIFPIRINENSDIVIALDWSLDAEENLKNLKENPTKIDYVVAMSIANIWRRAYIQQ